MRHFRSFAGFTALCSLAACLAFAPASVAARAKLKNAATGPGTLKVTVKDEAGNIVPGVVVSVLAHAGHKAAPATQPATQPSVASAKARRAAQAPAVAEGVTDANGMVVLNNVPAGSYNVVAREKKVGAARQHVVVASSTPLEVTLNIKKAQKK